MKKHQNRPLNLPPRPQNNVESVRHENNKSTLIGGGMGGGGLFYVITMSKEDDYIRKSVVNVLSRIVGDMLDFDNDIGFEI